MRRSPTPLLTIAALAIAGLAGCAPADPIPRFVGDGGPGGDARAIRAPDDAEAPADAAGDAMRDGASDGPPDATPDAGLAAPRVDADPPDAAPDGAPACADPPCDPPDAASDPPACANGLDDDGDGATDYPADRDCVDADGAREASACALDVPSVAVGQGGGEVLLPIAEGPGMVRASCDPSAGAEVAIGIILREPSAVEVQVVAADGAPAPGALHARSDCAAAGAEVACRGAHRVEPLSLPYLEPGVWVVFAEQGIARPAAPRRAQVRVTSLLGACNDGLDNDGDGRVDHADPGCADGLGPSEDDPPRAPACSDGLDNDGDGAADHPADPDCRFAGQGREVSCLEGSSPAVCIAALSGPCERGSAAAWCAARGGRVVSFAELAALADGGWRPPSADYHTLSVAADPACAGGAGVCDVRGLPALAHWSCGDAQDVCNRAIMCVQ